MPVRAQDRRPPVDGASPDLLGARMRQFRTEQGLTLRGLAARSGLSIGFLSQVGRGISSIGLSALGSVATALGRNVAEFFDEQAPPAAGAGAEPQAAAPVHFTLTRRETPARQYVSGQQTYQMLWRAQGGRVRASPARSWPTWWRASCMVTPRLF